ncbi:hypothetical protein [Streptomyces sp. SAS_260]|uniref:hypothetical protein n=1 Tax=Streptomyces sp. SAS_260 TaxID=3412751 RepID=UPI00403C1E52
MASSTAGESVVRGSWLPPEISAVLASAGVVSSGSLSDGAKTVAGSGTERSSPASALVSVPAQGVAPAGTAGASCTPDPPASGQAEAAGTPAWVSGSARPAEP